MHKVFISYHHGNDAAYKDYLLSLSAQHGIFIDRSVDTEEISDGLPDARIREVIRDDYLRDSTVTIVLVGTGTAGRKHVDWEIYSSMYDGARNKKSGLFAIMLPQTGCDNFTAAHESEKAALYPDCTSWTSVDSRVEYERRYPHLPARIIDQLLSSNAKVSVTNWARIESEPSNLQLLIETAQHDRAACQYDLSRPMRRANS